MGRAEAGGTISSFDREALRLCVEIVLGGKGDSGQKVNEAVIRPHELMAG